MKDLQEIKGGMIAIVGGRKSGKTSLAFQISTKLDKKYIYYFFFNLFNIIQNIKNIRSNIKFVYLENLNEAYDLFLRNSHSLDKEKITDAVFIFDDLSILSLEMKNEIKEYMKFNLFLSYLKFLSEYNKNINIFIINDSEEKLKRILEYWCDHMIFVSENEKNKLIVS